MSDAPKAAEPRDAEPKGAALTAIEPKGIESAPASQRQFEGRFARWARRVRARLTLRGVLTGVTLGLVAGVGLAAGLWYLRQGKTRPLAGILGLLGAAIGFAVARRRTWSDSDVALYLDMKLEAQEAISTAVELDPDAPARAAVLSKANEALNGEAPKGMWPRFWRLWHAAAPFAAGAIVWLSLVQLPPEPVPPPPPPGSEVITLAEVEGLEEVIALENLDARDAEQRERLKNLSERAKKLKDQLKKGMEKREAQAEIAKLRDDVSAERMKMGSGESREGLEAAMSKLAGKGELDAARKALGDRDLTQFDREMEKLANKLEEKDREAAKEALEEAKKAAEEKGAKDTAKALEEQKKLLDERGKRAQAMKELAEAFGDGLSDEAKKALEEMNRSGDPGASQQLAEEMGKALEGLSDEERKKLAEKLKQQASQMDPNSSDAMPMTKEQMEQMQKQLQSPQGQKQLQEQLKEWANQPPQSGESQRQQGLNDAEKGLDQAQKQLGTPMPMPAPGQKPGQGKPGQGNKPGQGKPGQGNKPGQGSKPGQGNNPGQGNKPGQGNNPGSGNGSGEDPGMNGGPSRGGGQGEHDGFTKPLTGEALRSRANTKLNPGAPNPGVSMGRGPGQAGDVSTTPGGSGVGQAGPGTLHGSGYDEVPEEYREQVGRYFQP